MFIRSYERGERVYLAMLSRGYEGSLPMLVDQQAVRRDWVATLALPLAAALISASAWTVFR